MSAHACSTHSAYRLGCDQYDALRAKRGGRCWRCSRAADRLEVDHDHALGVNAVRGMLCSPCNIRISQVESGLRESDALDADYLNNAWHLSRPMEYEPDARTPVRNFRVDEELWQLAAVVTRRRRETISGVVKRALVEYVEQHGGTVAGRDEED